MGNVADETSFLCDLVEFVSRDTSGGRIGSRRRRIRAPRTDRASRRWSATEPLLHGQRLCYCRFRFGVGGLGAGLRRRASKDREVGARM